MGKMDIDYQVLYDAFYKYQTKAKLRAHGNLYYEGEEFEVEKLTEISQRYGSPVSYPYLKIPGLNAPIASGASFGYHPGGWGKSPVDE
ncbi:conserved hypothetical protein [Ricinus communis]|uniref:Uncharacterized protein n=1 Tax=Ricinus communis TaxID=3988 RepID=B9SWG7_RICCO|nr:conserved hypothetical protein [Ricinus communis]